MRFRKEVLSNIVVKVFLPESLESMRYLVLKGKRKYLMKFDKKLEI